MQNEVNKHKQNFLAAKKERRVKKRTEKRDVTGEEVIFIFEKIIASFRENHKEYILIFQALMVALIT
jgi:hypothetical protein